MNVSTGSSIHSAADAALGFYYQSLYGLLALWSEEEDDAQIYFEKLDDVELQVGGAVLLQQLKHSLSSSPTKLTLKSPQLWKTLKAWIDILPEIDIRRTTFWLVTVADVSEMSPLQAWIKTEKDKTELIESLLNEARRVSEDRSQAAEKGEVLPHKERAPGCEAILELEADDLESLIDRITLKPNSINITNVQESLARSLKTTMPDHREAVARRMIEWWDVEVINCLSGIREKCIRRFEIIQQHVKITSEIWNEELTSPFGSRSPPHSHEVSCMIKRQIDIISGTEHDYAKARRDEWRAVETRSRWIQENPKNIGVIAAYDVKLIEEWADKHCRLLSKCAGDDESQREEGMKLFNWSYDVAHTLVGNISNSFSETFYVRGSYQFLSIDGRVGWHPDYERILGFKK